jgi:hypothetical protein
MIQSSCNADSEQIVEPMLALARCSLRHRIVVTGTHSAALMFALHRRGYAHVAITANSPLANGQYEVAFIDWRQKSIESLKTMLDWLMDFLDPAAVVVMCVDSLGSPEDRKILRSVLGKCGLSVETGTAGDYGLAISAWRECSRYKPKLL